MSDDLTIVMYTANIIPTAFASATYTQLLKAAQGTPIIVVSKVPMPIEEQNIVVDFPRSHVNIYRQALVGAKAATTRYIAMAEDDVLYSPEHFKRRPSSGKFAYNVGTWNIYTWSEPLFTFKGGGRRNLYGLICERELFIEAMEERFAKWPDNNQIDKDVWAEPGKYEKYLGVTPRETEVFYTNPPNIAFSHQTALSFSGLGFKKRLGEMRANEIPYWGTAEQIRGYYK